MPSDAVVDMAVINNDDPAHDSMMLERLRLERDVARYRAKEMQEQRLMVEAKTEGMLRLVKEMNAMNVTVTSQKRRIEEPPAVIKRQRTTLAELSHTDLPTADAGATASTAPGASVRVVQPVGTQPGGRPAPRMEPSATADILVASIHAEDLLGSSDEYTDDEDEEVESMSSADNEPQPMETGCRRIDAIADAVACPPPSTGDAASVPHPIVDARDDDIPTTAGTTASTDTVKPDEDAYSPPVAVSDIPDVIVAVAAPPEPAHVGHEPVVAPANTDAVPEVRPISDASSPRAPVDGSPTATVGVSGAPSEPAVVEHEPFLAPNDTDILPDLNPATVFPLV
jgi:hypothetical protein